MDEQTPKGRGWHSDSEGHATAGRKGGLTTALDRDHMSEIGRKGGSKHSSEHMREIGKRGQAAMRARLKEGELGG